MGVTSPSNQYGEARNRDDCQDETMRPWSLPVSVTAGAGPRRLAS